MFTMLKFILILHALVNFTQGKKIAFDNRNWRVSFGCTYVGDDIGQVQTNDYVECALECLNQPDCTHFDFYDSMCMLKRGAASLNHKTYVDDEFMYCGVIFRHKFSSYIEWEDESQGKYCYFDNYFVNKVDDDYDENGKILLKASKASKCSDLCREKSHCSHYTWVWKEEIGGQCHISKAPVTKEDALFINSQDFVCGIVNNVPIKSTSAPEVEVKVTTKPVTVTPITIDFYHLLLMLQTSSTTKSESVSKTKTTTISTTKLRQKTEPATTTEEEIESTTKPVKHKTQKVTISRVTKPVTEPSDVNYEVDDLNEGRFSVQFTMRPLPGNVESILLEANSIKLSINDQDVNLVDNLDFNKVIIKEPDFSILHFNASEFTMWISVNSKSRNDLGKNFLKIGFGYMYAKNTLFKFVPKNDKALKALQSIRRLSFDDQAEVVSHNVDNTSLVNDHTMLIYDHEMLDMGDLDEKIMLSSDLPADAQRLYDIVKGKKINLNLDEIDAINYSIDNEGCSLNEKLKKKAKRSYRTSDKKMSNLRVTFNDVDDDDATGQPYTIEIWPRGHYSPVHNHGNSTGIIKILDGSLKFDLYNPISDKYNEELTPVISTYAYKGNITWLTSSMYQTHKLSNDRSTRASISMQAYLNKNVIDPHEEMFNYVLPGDGKLKRLKPVSDYTFDELKAITMLEYKTKSCDSADSVNCCRYSGPMCGHYLKTAEMCMTPAEDNAVYQCNKNDGTFKLVEKCPGYCFQNYLSTKCRTKKLATAELLPGAWHRVKGVIFFEEIDGKTVRIYGRVEGLNPDSLHGMHIHEYGETSNKCMDSGPHFNPLTPNHHGNIDDQLTDKHAGDLGNIKANLDGVAIVELESEHLNLIDSSPYSVLDRSIVIHEKQDDLGQGSGQSTLNGNSGLKVACARIVLTNE